MEDSEYFGDRALTVFPCGFNESIFDDKRTEPLKYSGSYIKDGICITCNEEDLPATLKAAVREPIVHIRGLSDMVAQTISFCLARVPTIQHVTQNIAELCMEEFLQMDKRWLKHGMQQRHPKVFAQAIARAAEVAYERDLKAKQ